MLYPKEDKENRILLYAVIIIVIVLLFIFIVYIFSVAVVNINRQQTILVSM